MMVTNDHLSISMSSTILIVQGVLIRIVAIAIEAGENSNTPNKPDAIPANNRIALKVPTSSD